MLTKNGRWSTIPTGLTIKLSKGQRRPPVVPSSSFRHEGSILNEDLSCVGVSSQPCDDLDVTDRSLTPFLILDVSLIVISLNKDR